MSSIFFWKEWTKPYRSLWYLLSFIFFFAVAYMWFYYATQPDGVIQWEKIQQQKIVETTVHSFRLGPFQLNVPAESYVIFEYLQGGVLHHNTTASYLFLGILVFCAMIILTIITSLDGFWYYAGMGLFILFCTSLRFDVVALFNVKGILPPLIIISAYTAVSFYFKSVRSHTTFLK